MFGRRETSQTPSTSTETCGSPKIGQVTAEKPSSIDGDTVDGSRTGAAVILEGELLRALSSLLLSSLLVTTLVWGGCVSCEQYFMFGQSNGCCSPDGHCNKNAPGSKPGRDCKQIAFDHRKGIELHFDLPVTTVQSVKVPLRPGEFLVRWQHALPTEDPSPPDLQVLHSIFLI